MSGATRDAPRGHSAGTIGSMSRPVITFLTDFGPSAPAVCRGVMYGICPDAIVIDISHQVPRYSIREGSDTLVFALPYMPIGIHVAVVDPGVGTERLPVAIERPRGDILIGPDNGLLMQAADVLGGIEEARVDLEPRADAAGHLGELPWPRHLLAGGRPPRIGRRLRDGRADDLDRCARPVADHPADRQRRRAPSVVVGILIFGNATFAGTPADLEAAIGPLTLGRPLVLEFPAHGGASAVEDARSGRRRSAGAARGLAPVHRLGGSPRIRRQPGQRRRTAGPGGRSARAHPPGLSRSAVPDRWAAVRNPT